MKKTLLLTLTFLFLLTGSLSSQDTLKKATWFPKGNLYPTIILDYEESQIGGSMYALYAENNWQNRVFGIFSLGLRYNLVRWQHQSQRASELGFELSIFPQFIFEDPFENSTTSLFNIEFKVGVHYQVQLNRWRLRGRLYHISSHLGDDYIFRYGVEGFLDNTRIYEVVDFSAAWVNKWCQIYGTAGVIVHSAYERKPLLFQTGVQFEYPIGKKEWIRWVCGADLQLEQEQNFRPGIRIAGGFGIGKKGWYPVTIMADFYNGYMPYSLYDRVLINWIGASIWLNPFRPR